MKNLLTISVLLLLLASNLRAADIYTSSVDLDWTAINQALYNEPVTVHFSGASNRTLVVNRTTVSAHRLTLQGNGFRIQAEEGIYFPYLSGSTTNQKITVRGFEIWTTTD